MLTRVSNFTHDGFTINNENRKEFQIRKNAKTYSILELQEKLVLLQLRHLRSEKFLRFS